MYKVAILGCENSHADAFLNFVIKEKKYDDIEFVGVYSNEPEAAKRVSEQFGVKQAESFDEFVGKIDGLIVTARHGDNHYKYAKPYINSGIPMFIDKPITINPDEAVKFAKELEENKIRVTGGSSCIHAPLVQDLKRNMADGCYGKIFGGFLRAPILLESPYGGIYFYLQHAVQLVTEAFGNNVVSVMAEKSTRGMRIVFSYPEFDVMANLLEQSFIYSMYALGEKHMQGGEFDIDSYCFEREFDEFYQLLCGSKQKQSYADFISPVFIMNAVEKSMQTGKKENIIVK